MNKNMNQDTMSKEELYKTKSDIMRYASNKFGFWFCILAIIFDVAMFLIIYTEKNCTPDFQLGIDLLVNVIFLLACFLLAEKMKVYSLKSTYVGFAIAGIQILRIFWMPLKYFLHETSAGLRGLSGAQFTWCIVLLVASALSLVAASIVTMQRSIRLSKHLKEIEE